MLFWAMNSRNPLSTMQAVARITPMMTLPGVCAIFKPTGQPISNTPPRIR